MANIVDSSVWVALFIDFDTQHKKAGKFIKELRGTVYVPYCVINEVATVLTYKHSKKQADNFLAYLESVKDIILIDDQIYEEIAWYQSFDSRVSFTDAALILLSRKLKVALVTFDVQLARLAKKILE